MSYGKRGSRGDGASMPGFYKDREWSPEVKLQVMRGILQSCGRLPAPGTDKLAALFAGQDTSQPLLKDTAYTELGRGIGDLFKAAYKGGVPGPDGLPLLNPEELGPMLCGTESGMLNNLAESFSEGVETLSGGLISADDGGIDASLLNSLAALASLAG